MNAETESTRSPFDESEVHETESTKSPLVEFAVRELDRLGMFDDDADYEGNLGRAVVELLEVFSKQGHSGFSAFATVDLFSTLAMYKPLTAITSDPNEWTQVDSAGTLWQSSRNSTAFSTDGGKTYYFVNDEDKYMHDSAEPRDRLSYD